MHYAGARSGRRRTEPHTMGLVRQFGHINAVGLVPRAALLSLLGPLVCIPTVVLLVIRARATNRRSSPFAAPILDNALDLVTTSAFVRALPLHMPTISKSAQRLDRSDELSRQAGPADGQLNFNSGSCGNSPTLE